MSNMYAVYKQRLRRLTTQLDALPQELLDNIIILAVAAVDPHASFEYDRASIRAGQDYASLRDGDKMVGKLASGFLSTLLAAAGEVSTDLRSSLCEKAQGATVAAFKTGLSLYIYSGMYATGWVDDMPDPHPSIPPLLKLYLQDVKLDLRMSGDEQYAPTFLCVRNYLPTMKLRSVRLSVRRGLVARHWQQLTLPDQVAQRDPLPIQVTTFDELVRLHTHSAKPFQGFDPIHYLKKLVESMMKLEAREKSFEFEQQYGVRVLDSDSHYGHKQAVIMRDCPAEDIVAAATKPEGKLVFF